MDPFNKLPPELRLQILIFTNSKRSIWQLIRASPIMLKQYVAYKKCIERKLFNVDAEFDNDMLNDAIAIIRFPDLEIDHASSTLSDHENLWSEGLLATTWKKEKSEKTPISDTATRIQNEINRLYYRLVVLIEDYLTKATAACSPREYWCLPHSGGQLTFKDRAVCVRLDLTQCRSAERRRLLKAFLKYEVISKFCYIHGIKRWLWHHRYCSTEELFTSHLQEWEKEAIYCVEEYFQSLYRAVLVQCGNSQLPETLAARNISHAPDATEWEDSGLIPHEYTEGWMFSNHQPLGTLTLNSYELCQWLACFGLDLATTVVEAATAGPHARAIVGEWLKDLARRGPQCGFFRTLEPGQTVSSLLQGNTAFQDGGYLDGPGLYQRLYPRIEYTQDWDGMRHQDKYLKLYRSRAWVFFDDSRLFKSDGEGPQFPTDDIVFSHIRFNDIIGPRLHINCPRHSIRTAEWTPREESRHLSQLLSLREASIAERLRQSKMPCDYSQ
ncbi:hypothetical protein F4777DRAFT_595796 [Nemania sp. FL0916]|nr:hypothetical protein F4777DRAFT_595796 [Nemania sp. FL0916]